MNFWLVKCNAIWFISTKISCSLAVEVKEAPHDVTNEEKLIQCSSRNADAAITSVKRPSDNFEAGIAGKINRFCLLLNLMY